MAISIKNQQDIEKMRIAGKLASEVLDFITPHVVHGITTDALDKLCHDYMVDVQKTIPAPLNYAPGGHKPYPKSICTSINQQICHGVPSDKVLKNGDIVNIDITVIKDGYHGDTSRMFYIGEVSTQAIRFKLLLKKAATVLYVSFAAMVLVKNSTKIRKYCTTEKRVPGLNYRRE
jgi:methionyl aminopeptidase